jgi:hypothetical protein
MSTQKNQYYYIDKDKVIFEKIEDEIIIISQDTGIYYSIRGHGAIVWQLISSGLSIDEITVYFKDIHVSQDENVQSEIISFIEGLFKEGLIIAGQKHEHNVELEPGLINSIKSIPFSRPTFEKFENMKDYLLVDPIHEVDVAGWPYTKKNNPRNKRPTQ